MRSAPCAPRQSTSRRAPRALDRTRRRRRVGRARTTRGADGGWGAVRGGAGRSTCEKTRSEKSPARKKLARRARASSRHPFGARPCPMPPVPLPLRPSPTERDACARQHGRAGRRARPPPRARAEGRWCASRARSRERATNFFPRAPPASVFLKRSALRAGGAGTCAGMCGVPWQGGERCGSLGAWGRYRGRRQRVGLRPGERPRGLRPSYLRTLQLALRCAPWRRSRPAARRIAAPHAVQVLALLTPPRSLGRSVARSSPSLAHP